MAYLVGPETAVMKLSLEVFHTWPVWEMSLRREAKG
jgi:hypothetical protein